jgi:uncharacterized Ntn-hydrolase superfamily protein
MMRLIIFSARLSPIAAIILALVSASAVARDEPLDAEGTFSIVARDPVSGELGMGVQSKAFATASRTMTVKGGVVAIAHQATSNPMYGVVGLELIQAGMAPQQALDLMVRGDAGREARQVAIIDAQGRTAAWTGSGPQDWKGHRCGTNYCAQGNILVGPEVIDAIARSFESSSGPLAERLMAALEAGQSAGGDARGTQAAAIVVAKALAGAAGFGDRVVDIRVDDHRAPIAELRRLLNMLRSGQLATEAITKLRAGDLTAAMEAAQAATEKAPENDTAWVALAAAHAKAGRNAPALDAVRRAIEANPANRRQLPKNSLFETLRADPDFQRLMGS